MTVLDLLRDAGMGLVSRVGRSMLTLAGILLGTASLVITSGLAASAEANVAATFDGYEATQVTARSAVLPSAPGDRGLERLRARPGVSGVGRYGLYRDELGNPVDVRDGQQVASDVVATDVTSLRVSEPRLAEGRLFSTAHEDRRDRVALVGTAVAARMQVSSPSASPTILIRGVSFTVIGVIEDSPRRHGEIAEVIIPLSTATQLWESPATWEVIAVADRDQVQSVGGVIAPTIDPGQPMLWTVSIPPSPELLRQQVSKDLSMLYLALAGMSLAIGALAIGNTMSVSVLERTGEVGVRRALGMTRVGIVSLFAIEALILGVAGGLLGGGLGAVAVLVVDLVRDWPYTVPAWVLLASPGIGAVTGLLGGLVPALRAGRLSPATAVRA